MEFEFEKETFFPVSFWLGLGEMWLHLYITLIPSAALVEKGKGRNCSQEALAQLGTAADCFLLVFFKGSLSGVRDSCNHTFKGAEQVSNLDLTRK